jgi:hypothetical protein
MTNRIARLFAAIPWRGHGLRFAIAAALGGIAVLVAAETLRAAFPAIAADGGAGVAAGSTVYNGPVTINNYSPPLSAKPAPSELAQMQPQPSITGNCNAYGTGNNVTCAPQPLISEQAALQLVPSLKAAGSYKVSITSVMGDAQAFQSADRLKSALVSAGWDVDGVNQAVFTVPMIGVILSIAPKEGLAAGKVSFDNLPPAAASLIKAFRQNGVNVTGTLDPSIKDLATVNIIIGARPN